MNTIKLTAKIDTTEIDKAIEKAVRLQELLKEANSMARELASMELKFDVKVAPPGGQDQKALTEKDVQRIVDLAEKRFEEACRLFNLDIDKKIEQLSSGMKVKYSVAIALSHHAELLILDEPTSGLDPVSRDEILDIFREIVKNKDRAILFSTHITSDLDKCATDITYIHEGEIIYTGTKQNFIDSYFFVKDMTNNQNLLCEYVAYKEFGDHIEGLIKADRKDVFTRNGIEVSIPDLEQIMVYTERSKQTHESFTL